MLIIAYLQFGGKVKRLLSGNKRGASPWDHVMCAIMVLLQITGFILALLLNIFDFNNHCYDFIKILYMLPVILWFSDCFNGYFCHSSVFTDLISGLQ